MQKIKFFILILIILICSILAYTQNYTKEAYLICVIVICFILGMSLLKETSNSQLKESITNNIVNNKNQKNELDIARRVQQALISYDNPKLEKIKITKFF